MCLSVPNTGLVPVCVIGYLDCVLRTRCVYQYLTLVPVCVIGYLDCVLRTRCVYQYLTLWSLCV